MEDSDVVDDIFQTHIDSLKLLNMFDSVLIFGSIYKNNMCPLLVFQITCVTSTELTFSIGFSYFEDETCTEKKIHVGIIEACGVVQLKERYLQDCGD